MRLAKRLLLSSVLVVAVGLGALAATWLYIGRPGSTPVEEWIGREIVGVIESYVTPQVAFAGLDYRRPRTVVLRNFTLTSQGRLLLSVDQVLLDLAEVPREGKPILIQRIELNNPHIYLEAGADSQLIGWSQFVRPEVIRSPGVVPPGRRLSDVLVLRHVRIHGGEIHYSTVNETEPMVLPGIELALQTPPDTDEPGWYRIDGTLTRDPIVRADVEGRINLDTGLLELAKLKLAATLGEQQYQTLPPRLHGFLRRHEVQGEALSTFQGRVPLYDPARTEGSLTASLKDIRMRINEAAVVLASSELSAGFPDQPIQVEVNNGWFTNAGHTLLAAQRLIAELPGIPQAGQPVELISLQADRPQAELIHDPAGGFVGWNQLAQSSGEQASTSHSTLPSTAPAAAPEPLNSYVRVRTGEIRNGHFVYGLPGGGKPLVLNNVHIRLLPSPDRQPDWQPVTASARSDGLFRAALTGQFNLAALMLDLKRFTFRTNVAGPAQYDLLPDPVDSLFRRHGMTGDLAFDFAGQVPLARLADATGKAHMNLSRARMHFSGVEMPIEQATVDFDVPVGQVQANISHLALAGDDQPIVDIEHLRLDLAGPPQKDEPLQVRSAVLRRPNLRLIQAPDAGLLGWRRLVNPNTPWPRLSDFARFEQLEIIDGQVLYDDNDGNGEPMVLSGVGMQLNTPPLQDTPGVYRLIGDIHREGLFDIQLDGRIDPDAYDLRLNQLKFNGQLGPQQYSAFPPKAQDIMRRHELRGKVQLTASGTFPLNHLRNTTASIRAELTDAHMSLGQTVWPINRVAFDAALSERGLNSRYTADLFGGKVAGDVKLRLDPPQPLRVAWNASGVHMEDTLRVVQQTEPKYSGLLSTAGSFSINLQQGQPSLTGNGTIEVTNAKLVRLPVIRAVIAAVSTATLGLLPTHSDNASAGFQLQSDRVIVDDLDVQSDPIELRAAGEIGYDETVDMRVTAHAAGNIGRGIGKGLGRVGEIGTLGLLKRLPEDLGEAFGAAGEVLGAGENIVTYQVSGPLSNPDVTINGPGQ